MKQNMQQYFRAIQASPFRSAIPILTAPGIELARLKASDVFRSGALQFECIKALAETVRADAPVTFMDLSVEAEAFGAPVRCSEYENPTVSGSIASTAEEIDALPVPVQGNLTVGVAGEKYHEHRTEFRADGGRRKARSRKQMSCRILRTAGRQHLHS